MFFSCLPCPFITSTFVLNFLKLMVEHAKNCFIQKTQILALVHSLTEKIPHTSSDDWKDAKQNFWRSKSLVAIIHRSWSYKEIKPSWKEVFNGQRCLPPKSGQIGETARKISSWRPPMERTFIRISDIQYYLLFTIV